MQNLFAALCLALSLAVPSRPAAAADGARVTIAAGSVTAEFTGARDPSIRWGVEALVFRFSGDDRAYRFRPEGTLYPGDWRFDIFSPDGARVLLLQDRYGPYHVVRVEHLKAYLQGRAKPDRVIGATPKGEVATVKTDGRRIDDETVGYRSSCCGDTKYLTVRVK